MRATVLWAGCLSLIGVGCSRHAPPPQAPPDARPQSAAPAARQQAAAPDGDVDAADPAAAVPIEALIDQFVDVSEPGFGYSPTFSGDAFLPYDDSAEIGMGLLGGFAATPSTALREIVRSGVAAVPVLLKHMGDNRTTKIPPYAGLMWMEFADEYDFNRRTREAGPAGVNRDRFADRAHEADEPDGHTVTVGDLCFVALGQIVNRNFSATRYQPTGGLIVNSPTYSAALRQAILDDWSTLTPDSHRKLLVADFLQPDYGGRRIGAYRRLSLYYPDAVEEFVLAELSKPTFDVFVIEKFCRETLYPLADAAASRAEYERFLQQHGDHFAAGVREQLFDDVDQRDRFGSRPRDLLSELFHQPAQEEPGDRPSVDVANFAERARFIAALTHDSSQKIGDTVKALILEHPQDAYFASACLRCLASRGYDDFLIEQLDQIDPSDTTGQELRRQYLEAISTSRSPAVQSRLLDILKKSKNESYFMAALPAVDPTHDEEVLDAARKLLAGLPDDTNDGQHVLGMIGTRFPDQAEAIYRSFLVPGSANRAGTMCNVLWYGHPLSRELLTPLLDDKRELSGFSIPMRVCDRARAALKNAPPRNRTDYPGRSKAPEAQNE